MWLIICLQLFLLFYFMNDTSLAGLNPKILIVPLMAYLYYQVMRIVYIILYQKEPIMATAYWKEAFEEVEGRKITRAETGFTAFYMAFGFLALVIVYNLL